MKNESDPVWVQRSAERRLIIDTLEYLMSLESTKVIPDSWRHHSLYRIAMRIQKEIQKMREKQEGKKDE